MAPAFSWDRGFECFQPPECVLAYPSAPSGMFLTVSQLSCQLHPGCSSLAQPSPSSRMFLSVSWLSHPLHPGCSSVCPGLAIPSIRDVPQCVLAQFHLGCSPAPTACLFPSLSTGVSPWPCLAVLGCATDVCRRQQEHGPFLSGRKEQTHSFQLLNKQYHIQELPLRNNQRHFGWHCNWSI